MVRPWSSPDAAAVRSERELVAGLRRSDPEALRRLYEDYGGATFGYLLSVMGDRASAEDVQQEVFLDVWRRGGTYDPKRGSLGTWILTIARSRAIDALRKRVPEPRDPAVAVASAEPVEDPGASADALLERWRVAALLLRLPEEEARMLRLRFYDGFSQSEIASRTGIPLGTVKMRMVQGLDRLRGLIEREEGS
jgi:RNA polymerase sigma-70 factor (ECF subfamily)